MSTEGKMIAAHQFGLRDAAEAFGQLAQTAMSRYAGEPELQSAYIAGFVAELERIARRQARE